MATALEHVDGYDAPGLTEIVVTAAGFEQELRNAPASIALVSREDLAATQFRDLAEALRYVEGLDVRGGTGKTGGMNISIRGMPSDYTLVLIDGRRQNAATEVGQNGFGDAMTSFMPPAAAIERIEVIRGPMSTLYGADAMGGVVNIITRPITRDWQTSVSAETGVPQSSRFGATRRFDLYAAGPVIEDTLGVSLRGDVYRRDESERINPGANANTRDPAPGQSRQHTLGGRVAWTPADGHELLLDYQQDRTWYNNHDCRLGGFDFVNCNTGEPTGVAPGYHDWLRFNRDQVAVAQRSDLGGATVDSSLMRNTTGFLGRTIASTARPPGHPEIGQDRVLESTNLVFDTKAVAPLGDTHTLTFGGQWWQADLTDTFLAEPEQSQTSWAVFVEDEWRITEGLTATFGLRHDRHDRYGGQTSPRGYLVWTVSPEWTVKGGIGQGFMAPQMHFLVDGIGEVIRQGQQPNVGNPDLQPEVSTNTELAVLYDGSGGLRASATLFRNRIRDKIAFRGGNCATDPIPTCVHGQTTEPFVSEFPLNMDSGRTWGVELTSRIPLADHWTLRFAYTWLDSELIEDGVRSGRLSDSASHVGNAELTWAATRSTRLGLRGEYRGSSRRFDGDPANLSGNDRLEYEALGDLRGYALLHLGASYRPTSTVTLNANVYNLLDRDFTVHRGWTDNAGDEQPGSPYYRTDAWTKGMTAPGRTFRVSATYAF